MCSCTHKLCVEGNWGKGWIFVFFSGVMEERFGVFFVCFLQRIMIISSNFFSDILQCVQLHTPSRTVAYTLSCLQACVVLEVGGKDWLFYFSLVAAFTILSLWGLLGIGKSCAIDLRDYVSSVRNHKKKSCSLPRQVKP